MSDATLLLTLLASGLGTFLIRLSFIAGERWLPRSERLHAMLRYVPMSVLAALVAPELLMREGVTYLATDNLRLWAGLIAIFVAWRSRSVIATIAVGLITLWLFRWLSA